MRIDQARLSAWMIRLAVSGLVLAAATPVAHAIPSFARQYETSCQTCHTAFPALTPFGEAFRRNGYRFPEGQDEERSMDEPIALGHEVHGDMFPDEVWPGEIPGGLPIAAFINASAVLQHGEGAGHAHGASPAIAAGHDDHGAGEEEWQTNFRDSDMGLLLGGTFGEHISFFGKLEVGGHGEVLLERPHLVIAPLHAPLLMFRIGAFDPNLHSFSVHRANTSHTLPFTTVSLGANGWAPEPEQLGVEATGVAYHRLGWTAGVVEGSGNASNMDKDVYGRLEYKIGGMSLDGYEPTGESSPWAEQSLTVGAFGYRGVATFTDPTGVGGPQSDRFWRAGADVQVRLVDVSITLAGFRQHDQRPVYGQRASGVLDGGMLQVEYVVFPWLLPTARWEVFRQDLPGSDAEIGQRFTLGVTALLRANIAIRALALARDNPEANPELQEVSLGLSAAF